MIGVRGLNDPHELDLMVMQRIGIPASVKFMRWAMDNGIAISIDADDALWAIERRNQAWRSWNGGENHWRYMDEAALVADLTTVTTGHLAKRYGKHGRVEVVPELRPAEVFDFPSIRHEYDETVALGWSGFVSTHPGDLPVVGDAVRRAIEDTGSILRIVGDGGGGRA